MTDTPNAGRACELCEAEPAKVSLMDLDDYSTVVVGLACMGPFFTELGANMVAPLEGRPAEPAAPGEGTPPAGPPEDAASDGPPPGADGAAAATGPGARPARTRAATGGRKGHAP